MYGLGTPHSGPSDGGARGHRSQRQTDAEPAITAAARGAFSAMPG
jgi:hypothetical protein